MIDKSACRPTRALCFAASKPVNIRNHFEHLAGRKAGSSFLLVPPLGGGQGVPYGRALGFRAATGRSGPQADPPRDQSIHSPGVGRSMLGQMK